MPSSRIFWDFKSLCITCSECTCSIPTAIAIAIIERSVCVNFTALSRPCRASKSDPFGTNSVTIHSGVVSVYPISPRTYL